MSLSSPLNTIILPSQLNQLLRINELSKYSTPTYIEEVIKKNATSNLAFRFLVISGPSGVGKSEVISSLRSNLHNHIKWDLFRRITTRLRRPFDSYDEILFNSEEKYEELKNNGGLLYSETYGGNSSQYGISTEDFIRGVQGGGADTVFVIIGTIALTQILPKCMFVYLLPPSLDELRNRLKRSKKPNSERLLDYDIAEMKSIISLSNSDFANNNAISILVNKNNMEDQCAENIREIVLQGKQQVELPETLVSQLSG